MFLSISCCSVPFVLVQKPKDDFEVDRVVAADVDDTGVCFLVDMLVRGRRSDIGSYLVVSSQSFHEPLRSNAQDSLMSVVLLRDSVVCLLNDAVREERIVEQPES
jgi:hypothetical protein